MAEFDLSRRARPNGVDAGVAMAAAAALAACGADDTPPPSFFATEAARDDTTLLPRRRALATGPEQPSLPTAAELLHWAEDSYPDLFPGPQPDRQSAPFIYRYYPASGNYLGVSSDGNVYVLGPVSADELVRVGSVTDFAPRVHFEPRPLVAADVDAARELLQVQFSATAAEIDAVKRQGFPTWLAAQIAAPRSQTGVKWLDVNGFSDTSGKKQYITTDHPSNQMLWTQLWTAQDAVRMRAALALSEFFVISSEGFNCLWKCYSVAAFWDILVANAFGNFRNLLEQVTLSSAMGLFLNIIGSQKADASGRQPDENYAREVMQLFSIGLYELHPDGSAKLGANGQPIETIDNDDVTNLARVFTGYTFAADPGPPRPSDDVVHKSVPNTEYVTQPMRFWPELHSPEACEFLGTRIAAGTDAVSALRIALDTLFRHPNVGPFFGRQMIQRLVTSNPSPAYVRRVAEVFADNGRGVRGDLAAVFAAIWLDPEARGTASTDAARMGKLREPMLRLLQWGRSFATRATRSKWMTFANSFEYGEQLPLRGPSVFNFFRPGHVPPGTVLAEQGWVAPEMQLVNESSVAAYLNFYQTKIRYGMHQMQTQLIFDASGVFVGSLQLQVPAEYAEELKLRTAPTLVRHLNLVLCAGQVPIPVQQTIIDALNAMPAAFGKGGEVAQIDRIAAAVLLVMGSPEYLVQR